MSERQYAVPAGKTAKKEGTFRYCQTEGCDYKMAVENTDSETDTVAPDTIAA